MKRFLLVVTEELFDAIEHARGTLARNPWLEQELRKSRFIQRAAKEIDVEFKERQVRDYEYKE